MGHSALFVNQWERLKQEVDPFTLSEVDDMDEFTENVEHLSDKSRDSLTPSGTCILNRQSTLPPRNSEKDEGLVSRLMRKISSPLNNSERRSLYPTELECIEQVQRNVHSPFRKQSTKKSSLRKKQSIDISRHSARKSKCKKPKEPKSGQQLQQTSFNHIDRVKSPTMFPSKKRKSSRRPSNLFSIDEKRISLNLDETTGSSESSISEDPKKNYTIRKSTTQTDLQERKRRMKSSRVRERSKSIHTKDHKRKRRNKTTLPKRNRSNSDENFAYSRALKCTLDESMKKLAYAPSPISKKKKDKH